MQRIEDPNLASKLRAKVIDFNSRGALTPAVITLAFVIIPLAFGSP